MINQSENPNNFRHRNNPQNQPSTQHKAELSKTGKPKLHGKVSSNDCQVKYQTLKVLTQGNFKSTDIYRLSNYSGSKKHFSSNLSKYVKRGYINKLGTTKPHFYQLTDRGQIEVDNPLHYRQERIKIHNEKMQNAKNKSTEVVYVNSEGGGSGSSGRDVSSNNDIGGIRDYHKIDVNKPESNKPEIEESVIEKTREDVKFKTWDDVLSMKNVTEGEFAHIKRALRNLLTKSSESKGQTPDNETKEKSEKVDDGVKYHSVLIKNINKQVTEKVFNDIPRKFIKMLVHKTVSGVVMKRGLIRLETKAVASKYVKNKDAEYVEFTEMTASKPLYLTSGRTPNGFDFYYTRNLESKKVESYNITEITRTEYNKLVNPNKQRSTNQSKPRPNSQQRRNQQNRR